VTVAGIGALAAFVALPGLRHIAAPQRASDIKPTLRFLAQHQQLGDTLWVYHASQYALRYYLECGCFGRPAVVQRGRRLWPLHPAEGGEDQFSPTLQSVPPRFIVSRSVRTSNAYRSELRNLLGRRRVWILVSDANTALRLPILTFLNRHGARLRAFRSADADISAAAYLYDLRRTH
jgi:hypothetical protein